MSLDTAVYAAGLSLAYGMYAGRGMDVMKAAQDAAGAYLGEMAADKLASDTPYADTAGAAAGAYGVSYLMGAGDMYCAVIGGVAQKLGDMYPLPMGGSSKSE